MAELKNLLKKTLEKIAIEQNYKDAQIEINEFSTEGANYSSAVFKVKITSPNKTDLLLFAKVATMSETLRQQIKGDVFYQKEKYIYQDLVKVFNEIQDKYNVPEEERYKFPKFYGCHVQRMEETFVLEDLVAQGYDMYDRFKPVTLEYASKAIEEIAKFHALSIAFHNEKPDEFPSENSDFNFISVLKFGEFRTSLLRMADMTLNLVPEDTKDRLREFVNSIWTEENIKNIYGPTKWHTLVHGDFRASNILYKQNENKVESLIPVDYQTVRLGSPSTDILYFIYSGTDEEFRNLHLKSLLDLYYNTVARFLNKFNMDPEIVFSRKDFDEDYKKVIFHGLTTSMFLLPFVLVDPENAPQLNVEGANFETFTIEPNQAFRKRFLPILKEHIEMGVL